MKEKISKYLHDCFSAVYCDSCEHRKDDDCDDCHRKNMYWSLSKECANDIAEELLTIVDEPS